jgi:hypothetical protein
MKIYVFVGFSRIFLLGILIFTARRLYNSFGIIALKEDIKGTAYSNVSSVPVEMLLYVVAKSVNRNSPKKPP